LGATLAFSAARGQVVRAYSLAHVAGWVTIDPVQVEESRCSERTDACEHRNRRVIVECQG